MQYFHMCSDICVCYISVKTSHDVEEYSFSQSTLEQVISIHSIEWKGKERKCFI